MASSTPFPGSLWGAVCSPRGRTGGCESPGGGAPPQPPPHPPPFPPKDTLGGGFDATQAFVGELAHFNIWDRKLTPGEVHNLATCSPKALAGNVIAWAEAQIDIYGGATKWTFEACRQLN